MGILKNGFVGKVKGVTMLFFGQGTLESVVYIREKGIEAGIVFRAVKKHKIGFSKRDKPMNSDKWKPEVFMSFTKIETIENLIIQLKEVKENLIPTLHQEITKRGKGLRSINDKLELSKTIKL